MHAQITQNNNFAISLQYLKKKVRDEFYYFHSDKPQSFFQVDTLIFGGCAQSCLKYLK